MRPQSQPGPESGGHPVTPLSAEPIEYMTIDWDEGHVAHMLGRLNELGEQGWEACAQVHARVGDKVIGRAQPGLGLRQVPLLTLKRRRAA